MLMTAFSCVIALSLLLGLCLDCHAFAPRYAKKLPAVPRNGGYILAQPPLSASARPVVDWAKGEPLESLLPRDDLLAIASEILSDPSVIDDSEEIVSRNWQSLERRLQSEERSVREIIGERTYERALKSVRNLNEYDPDSVKAFLGSEAVNALFARVLYDGIFEFVQKIDIFGNIVNSLPIIGPIRQQIVRETKKSLDKSLGPLVQNFLGTYTKVAVLQAIDFILSPSNRKAFGSANARLISSLLQRPVNTLLPDSDITNKLKDDAFAYLRDANLDDVERYVNAVYDITGDKSLDDIIAVDRLIDASPTLQKRLDTWWEKARSAVDSAI